MKIKFQSLLSEYYLFFNRYMSYNVGNNIHHLTFRNKKKLTTTVVQNALQKVNKRNNKTSPNTFIGDESSTNVGQII